jgi:hypothetical protein
MKTFSSVPSGILYQNFFSLSSVLLTYFYENVLLNIIYFIGSYHNVSVYNGVWKRFHRVCKRFHQLNIILFIGSSVWVNPTLTTRFRLAVGWGSTSPLKQQQQPTFTTLQAAAASRGRRSVDEAATGGIYFH